MPNFFFHLQNTTAFQDTLGTQLDGIEAAKCHAVTVIAEALCANPNGFWEAESYEVTVSDEWGLTLFMISIMSVVAPVLRLPA